VIFGTLIFSQIFTVIEPMNTKFEKYNHIDLLRSAIALLTLTFFSYLKSAGFRFTLLALVFSGTSVGFFVGVEFIIVCCLVLFFSARNFVTELPEKLFNVESGLC
jgi:hypothetical protein